MNLETHIKKELWQAISSTYESKNYSHTILDAIHYLSNVLREKAGVDGDGTSLVGQALAGKSPRLKINKGQTETERNAQEGFVQILMGLYRGIRNPRSHEQIEDTKDTADAIVCFINYLFGILDQSKTPFTISDFLSKVFDPYFVKSERYAKLLVEEIPANKLTDTIIELYRMKLDGDGDQQKYVFNEIVKHLSNDQLADFLTVVSEELKTTRDTKIITCTLQILPPRVWPQIEEVARLRIETQLISSVESGKVENGTIKDGQFGTWARDYIRYFTLKREISRVLVEKLTNSWSSVQQHYVAEYFMGVLPDFVNNSYTRKRCVEFISKKIREGDHVIRNQLVYSIDSFPEDWQNDFIESLQDLINTENPEKYLSNGMAFIGEESEIPF